MQRFLAAAIVGAAFVACVASSGHDGDNGRSCTLTTLEDGSSLLTCPDGTHVVIRNGRDASSCHIDANTDGTKTVSCPDGSSAVLANGQDGSSCSVHDNGNGTKTISCTDGTSAIVRDGASCSVHANGNGTSTIACSDGTSVIVSDGRDGASCSVRDNGNQTSTIACGDGTSVIVSNGHDGAPCTATDNGDGSATIACPDGSRVTVKSGTSCSVATANDGLHTISCTDGTTASVRDGSSCAVHDNGDGTHAVTCGDGSSAVLRDGTNGAAGTSCSVSANADGTSTIRCTDGSSATVPNGKDGSSCTVRDNANGTHTIACADGSTAVVKDGANGTNGTSCSVKANADGTKTIACNDGTSVTVSDGRDGTSCSVKDNGNGTKTISCTDGTSVTVANGASGADGSACSVKDNGDGTITISCTNGTSVTFSASGTSRDAGSGGGFDAGTSIDAGSGADAGSVDAGSADAGTGGADAGTSYDSGSCGAGAAAGTSASDSCDANTPIIAQSGTYRLDLVGRASDLKSCKGGGTNKRDVVFQLCIGSPAKATFTVRPDDPASATTYAVSVLAGCSPTGGALVCGGTAPFLRPGTYSVWVEANGAGMASLDVKLEPADPLYLGIVDQCPEVPDAERYQSPVTTQRDVPGVRIAPGYAANESGTCASGNVDAVGVFNLSTAKLAMIQQRDRSGMQLERQTIADACPRSSCDDITGINRRTVLLPAGRHFYFYSNGGTSWTPGLRFYDVPPPTPNPTCATAKDVTLPLNETAFLYNADGSAPRYYKFTLSQPSTVTARITLGSDGQASYSISRICGDTATRVLNDGALDWPWTVGPTFQDPHTSAVLDPGTYYINLTGDLAATANLTVTSP